MGAIQRDGITVVPLSIYFNERGRAKVELGLARGKRKADKRQAPVCGTMEARHAAG